MSNETLPASWTPVEIEDVLLPYPNGKKIRQGWSPQCENHPAESHDDWAVLRTSAIQDGTFVDAENKKLPPSLEPRTQLEVIAGDILMTCAGPRARCGVTSLVRSTRPRLLISGKMYQLRADPEIVERHFLEFFLRESHTKKKIDEMKTGISDSGLNLTHDRFRTLTIPLPPLPEQKRIVAKIEELFSELEAGEASLRKARRQLGVYRQSLLKQAFEGKLAQKWRTQHPETEPASNFLERILEQRRKQWNGAGKYKEPVDAAIDRGGEIPENWTWTATDSVCSQITDGEHIQPRYRDQGLPMLTAKHVRDGYVVFDDAGLIAPEDFETCLKRCAPTKNDVLIVSVGATTGRTGIVGDQPQFALVRSVLLLRPLLISPQYLMRWNQSPWCMRWKTSASGATAQPHLYIKDTRRMPIPLCTLPEQQEIVRLLDAQFEAIERNERELDAALQRSEALRQSILKKAFSGRLVPQDPSDEPAPTLLARLRTERASMPSIKRKSSLP